MATFRRNGEKVENIGLLLTIVGMLVSLLTMRFSIVLIVRRSVSSVTKRFLSIRRTLSSVTKKLLIIRISLSIRRTLNSVTKKLLRILIIEFLKWLGQLVRQGFTLIR